MRYKNGKILKVQKRRTGMLAVAFLVLASMTACGRNDGTVVRLEELKQNTTGEQMVNNALEAVQGEADREAGMNDVTEKESGEDFYDTGIGLVGVMEPFYERVYSENYPEVLLLELDFKRLQVDEQFEGAAAINKYLLQHQENSITYAKDGIEWLEEEAGNGIINSSYTSKVSEISFFDNYLLSFKQEEYDYPSGATHGMPYWVGFTFNLQTGERLILSDIISDSEEELKTVVTKYFAELIDANPESFWGDAKESVREWTDYDSDFYLTEEGICFYFEPYALASYGEGFQQVVIPYEEFEMKISLDIEQARRNMSKAETVGGENAGEKTVEMEIEGREDTQMITTVSTLPSDGESWGLSFGEEGSQPVGNASREELAQFDAYFMGASDEKVIYLTFDCGYENGNTEPILDALKKHNAQATFFVVGHFLETAPELVERMVEEGHTVGSHTYNHPDITTLSGEIAFREEMDAVKAKFQEVTGTELTMYYRPPEGKCSSENLRTAQKLGYSTFFWSLAYVDWDTENQPSHKEAMEKLTSRVHPGAVVLLHNTSQTNGEILDELLTEWEEDGYTVRPLAELVEKAA